GQPPAPYEPGRGHAGHPHRSAASLPTASSLLPPHSPGDGSSARRKRAFEFPIHSGETAVLANTVTANTVIGAGGNWIDPATIGAASIATTCHFATVYWLFRTEFNRVPRQAEIAATGGVQPAITSMIARAARRTNPLVGALALTTGSVVIFEEG